MLNLDVLQNRWVLLALAGGVVLVLAMVLACLELWRPREESPPGPAAAAPFSARVPWFLALTIAGIAAYAVIYVLVRAMRPPNWEKEMTNIECRISKSEGGVPFLGAALHFDIRHSSFVIRDSIFSSLRWNAADDLCSLFPLRFRLLVLRRRNERLRASE